MEAGSDYFGDETARAVFVVLGFCGFEIFTRDSTKLQCLQIVGAALPL
jgi:hypothetical protein